MGLDLKFRSLFFFYFCLVTRLYLKKKRNKTQTQTSFEKKTNIYLMHVAERECILKNPISILQRIQKIGSHMSHRIRTKEIQRVMIQKSMGLGSMDYKASGLRKSSQEQILWPQSWNPTARY